MRRRSVRSPDGVTWTIRRHWVARHPRFRWLLHPRKLTGVAEWLDIPIDDVPGALWLLVAILGLALLAFFVIPALIFLLELLVFLAVVSLLAFVNSLFRRAWIVEAVSGHAEPRMMRWRVVGLFRSRRVIDEIAQALEQGQSHIEPVEAERLEEPST